MAVDDLLFLPGAAQVSKALIIHEGQNKLTTWEGDNLEKEGEVLRLQEVVGLMVVLVLVR